LAGNKADDRFLHVGPDELSGSLFRVAANFANHDDRLGLRIAIKQIERVHKIRSDDWIATNADCGGLSDAALRKLMYGLVGQCARSRDDANIPLFVNVSWHDANLAFARRNNPRTIRADQSRAPVLQKFPGTHHVERGNAL